MLFFKALIFAVLAVTISADTPNAEKNGNPGLRRSVDTSSRMIRRHPDGEPTGGCSGGEGGH
ncbi:hypothetical protein DFH28DRAFT_1118420 [Melampsora americana]|nr:hypothetical protein DFH28DRAFT_1118420 [Melampsora americana]